MMKCGEFTKQELEFMRLMNAYDKQADDEQSENAKRNINKYGKTVGNI